MLFLCLSEKPAGNQTQAFGNCTNNGNEKCTEASHVILCLILFLLFRFKIHGIFQFGNIWDSCGCMIFKPHTHRVLNNPPTSKIVPKKQSLMQWPADTSSHLCQTHRPVHSTFARLVPLLIHTYSVLIILQGSPKTCILRLIGDYKSPWCLCPVCIPVFSHNGTQGG